MEKGALLQPGFRGQQHRIDQPQGHIHVGKGHSSPFTGYQPYALTGRTVVPLVHCPLRHPGPPALLQVIDLH